MLASVSSKLAKHCTFWRSVVHLSIDSDVLTIFFEWVLRRPTQTGRQDILLRAWQFGREWEIPAFQNEVMRCLVAKFDHNHIDLYAMRQAYGAKSSKDVAGDKLLRKAFIAEFAFESQGKTWCEEDMIESGLDKCTDFHRDCTYIMCLVPNDKDYDPREEGAQIRNLLVDETIE